MCTASPPDKLFLKLLGNNTWVNKYGLMLKWSRQLPPEYFWRRKRHLRTFEAKQTALFGDMARRLEKAGYITRSWIDPLHVKNCRWQARITKKGLLFYSAFEQLNSAMSQTTSTAIEY